MPETICPATEEVCNFGCQRDCVAKKGISEMVSAANKTIGRLAEKYSKHSNLTPDDQLKLRHVLINKAKEDLLKKSV